MGFGDVKLAAGHGPLPRVARVDRPTSRWPVRCGSCFYALMLGCVLGVVFGLAVQVATKKRGAFPFGPALALGCYVVVLFAAGPEPL